MELWQTLVTRFRSRNTLHETAAQIADRCFDSAWQRVSDRLSSLSTHESRGYIRARSAMLLNQHVSQAVHSTGMAAETAPRLYQLAVEALIERVRHHARDVTRQKFVRRAA